MTRAWLSLGSNLGNAEANIRMAVEALANHPGITLEQSAAFYRTAPQGGIPQDDFINSAVEITTTLSPEALLEACLSIEADIGRVRTIRWGPRVIDIDIIFGEKLNIATDRLTIPHPRWDQRAFVLVPLRELAEVPSETSLLREEILRHYPSWESFYNLTQELAHEQQVTKLD